MKQFPRFRWLLGLSLTALLAAGCQSIPQFKVDDVPPARVGEPSKDVSFWKETVTYPFPVHYATAEDGRGIEWEVAYMDAYAGKPEDKAEARTLVLIHGKGADSGYWSALMEDALAAGLRVVAVDLPYYGKSIPGNLDNPRARTLEDTRVVVHDVLVNQLGIEQASYLGHSLGGQWVLGYALDYPQAVEKLIVEDAGAFETYPQKLKLPNGELNWLDPAYAHDYEQWEQTWEPVFHRLESERNKTPEELALFHFFKKKDPDTGEIVDANVGFYKAKTPDAVYASKARIAMIQGPEEEFEAWNIAYNRDVYSMAIELLEDDPDSIPARLHTIEAPMFIAFGDEDPFLPATAVTGNTSLRMDYVKPTAEAIVASGGPEPVVKFYEGAGHFPHTDLPEQFNTDVINFVYGKAVAGAEDPSDYEAPPVELPADIAAFAEEFLAALNTGKADKIMAFYSKDFKSDGRNYQQTKDIYEQYGAMTAGSWDLDITGLEVNGDQATLQGSLSNQFTTGSLNGTMLIKEDGRWKMYGNQK